MTTPSPQQPQRVIIIDRRGSGCLGDAMLIVLALGITAAIAMTFVLVTCTGMVTSRQSQAREKAAELKAKSSTPSSTPTANPTPVPTARP